MNIASQLAARSLESAEKYETQIRNKLPDPYKYNEKILLGSYSFFFPTSNKRIVVKAGLLQLPGVQDTAPTIARNYIELIYKHGPWVRHDQMNIIYKGIAAPPNMARPVSFEHGFYVDIKSTYWSIMQIVGWDPDYWPEKWLSPGRAPADFPFPEDKTARNCLVSSGLITTVPVYLPHDIHPEPLRFGSKIINYSLWRLIGDVLNTIAVQAVRLGAVYVNNDGFIAPSPESAAKVIQLILDWGLTPRIKGEGAGGVKGAGAYRVGRMESMPYKIRAEPHGTRGIVVRKYGDWLQKRFSFWAAERKNN